MKSITRNSFASLVTGVLLTSAPGVHAAFTVVDHFENPAVGQATGITNGIVGSNQTSLQTGLTTLGGSRSIYLEDQNIYDAGNQATVSANGLTSPHLLSYANDANVDSFCRLTWDANSAGLNANLSTETGLQLTGLFNDLPTNFTISLVTFGGGTSTFLKNSPGLFTGDIAFPLSGFTGGANLADVDRIVLTIEGGRSVDVRLDGLVIVPEPASAGLALLGGVGLLLRRRRV